MAQMKRNASVAAVIGDVVGSRTTDDRRRLHARLSRLLDDLNAELDPLVPLRITVGDEYQGCFDTVGEALVASLALQVAALPGLDLRHGVGWGPVTVLEEEPRVEDGPGWWSAREAIEWVKQEAARAGARSTRTAYRRAEGVAGPDEPAVGAALLLRDQLVGGLSERGLSVLRGLMAGRSQREVAEELGISPSAVSQRVRGDGLAMLVAAQDRLREVR